MFKFERINDDNFKLTANGKEFTFTRTVELAKELQSVDLKKTIKLIEFLADRGETIETTKLRIERKNGNETIIDESNLEAIKATFEPQIMSEILDNLLIQQIGINMVDLLGRLNLEPDEIERFGKEMGSALINGIPQETPRK